MRLLSGGQPISHGRTELVRLLSGQPLAEFRIQRQFPLDSSAYAIGPSRVGYQPTCYHNVAAPANVDIPPRALRAVNLVVTSDAGAPVNRPGTRLALHRSFSR